MEIYSINEATEVVITASKEAASAFAAVRFIHIGQEAIQKHGSFSVALSGGSSPKQLYEILTSESYANRLDWSKVHIFWSDERAVADTHPESNYRMAMQFFAHAPYNQAKFFKMRGDADNLDDAAREYEHCIKENCYNQRFDLILLGIGQDAHTASLFPYTKGLEITDRFVCANFVPQLNSWRMTLTFSCINQADKVIVLTFGKDKGAAIKNIIAGDRDIALFPAQKLGTGIARVLYIIDRDTADEAARLQ